MGWNKGISANKVKKFANWLRSAGLEEHPTTNPHEVFRFKYHRGALVLYQGAKGFSPNCPDLETAFDAYTSGQPYPWREKVERRITGKGIKARLALRDGHRCFYCGLPFTVEDDATEEHLLSLIHGGNNRLENKALAHRRCNELAGRLPIVEKVKLRERLHQQNRQAIDNQDQP